MKTIFTERFILQKLSYKHLEQMFCILSNPNVVKTLNMKIHKTIEDTKDLFKDYVAGFKNNSKYPFEIIDKKTKAFLGVFLIKLDIFDIDSFEYTIYLDEKYRGLGIYQEVFPFMVDFVFTNINTGNFRGFIMEDNIASKKVLQYYGFKLEKIFKVEGLQGKIFSYLKTREEYLSE